ncbi:MAG: hypothetical protein D6692_08300 [Planctomycetota bacterium]|nr:MAG: hypothetical protein D6692_08300 [Planctomycetota bacterium]
MALGAEAVDGVEGGAEAGAGREMLDLREAKAEGAADGKFVVGWLGPVLEEFVDQVGEAVFGDGVGVWLRLGTGPRPRPRPRPAEGCAVCGAPSVVYGASVGVWGWSVGGAGEGLLGQGCAGAGDEALVFEDGGVHAGSFACRRVGARGIGGMTTMLRTNMVDRRKI